MNKTATKNYAIWARVQLIEAAKQRAFEYAITDGENDPNLEIINGRILSTEEKNQRAELISLIKQKGFEQVMEEAAYTWFNRFIALRFMEVNGYLPTKVRVFTDENNEFKPQILKEAMTVDLEGIDREKILGLIEKQDNEELFKYLIIAQCNALSSGLPGMFETISNWTELLFPGNLLKADSVIGQMITTIPEEDWTDQVQIIGWLYQYYNSELKDDTFAKLKKNIKITKERIPAATQLFTPDWIVRYMVENSLGRLWYEGHTDFDKSEWKYYLDEAEQEPEVEEELKKIRAEYSQIKPEEIKVIDPCMGSGHILVYAFDVLMQIYTSAGWSERDAAKSILENNLFGLDIDDRAGQLAYFAVMMKARKYSRRIMTLDLQPNMMSIQDSSFMTNELIDFVAKDDIEIKNDLRRVKEIFTDAKEYGSILIVPELGYKRILERIDELQNNAIEDIFQVEHRNIAIERLQPLVKQAVIMSQKYDVIVTNPPYMGGSGMNAKLSEYLSKNYPDSKSDLFAAFIERGNGMSEINRFNCMVTMQSWMYLTSYEKMRVKLLQTKTILSLLHLESMVLGIAFGISITIFSSKYIQDYKSFFNEVRLSDIVNERPREFPLLNNYCGRKKCSRFSSIPGNPIAYWASDKCISAYIKGKTVASIAEVRDGFTTGDNNLFLRLWFEPSIYRCNLTAVSKEEAIHSGKKWFPYNKGGDFRKWYGNNNYVINWENDGQSLKQFKNSVLRNQAFAFHKGITWTLLSNGGHFGARFSAANSLFDTNGKTLFPIENQIGYILGLMLTKVAKAYLRILNPTMAFQVGDICRIPVIMDENRDAIINVLSKACIIISKNDWDSFETSWDFKKHPLI